MAEFYEENEKSAGQVQIADEVIAIIAGTAATEVEGVEMAPRMSDGSFGGIFGKKNNPAKGIKVSVEDGTAVIEAEIAVMYGVRIIDAAKQVQEKIKSAVENMTGLSVMAVNVNVSAIITKTKAEKEEE